MVMKRHLPQSDNEEIITDASGNGSVAVTLKNPYPHTDYGVHVTPQEADNEGNYEVVSKTKIGFTIAVTGAERKCTEVIDASSVAITFADADPDTITRASGDWTVLFAVGDIITISDDGSDVNAGSYEIAVITSTVITLIASDELTAESNVADTFTIVNDRGVEISWIGQRNS